MAEGRVVVRGYREFLRACNQGERDTKRFVRDAFRKSGDIVRDDARERMAAYSAVSAAGYRTTVRIRGVAVESRIRKKTGQHPEYGAFQMRHAFLPALAANERRVYQEFDYAMDKVAAHFNQ